MQKYRQKNNDNRKIGKKGYWNLFTINATAIIMPIEKNTDSAGVGLGVAVGTAVGDMATEAAAVGVAVELYE